MTYGLLLSLASRCWVNFRLTRSPPLVLIYANSQSVCTLIFCPDGTSSFCFIVSLVLGTAAVGAFAAEGAAAVGNGAGDCCGCCARCQLSHNKKRDREKIRNRKRRWVSIRIFQGYGTGSWPPGFHGPQRIIRLALNQTPRQAPCLMIASRA